MITSNRTKRSSKRWSTVIASNWESTFLKSVFFRLDHHLTWDPHFHIENDSQIYTKFAAWLFNRQLGAIKRSFKWIVIYVILYTIAIIISSILTQQWTSLIAVVIGHSLLALYYYKLMITFNQQYHLRSNVLQNTHTATSALQALSEANDLHITELSTIQSLDYEEANIEFAKATLIPFLWLSTVPTAIDILFSTHLFLICFPMTLTIFLMTRCLLLPVNNAVANKTDPAMWALVNLGLILQLFLNQHVITWDKWLIIFLLCIFSSISMRFYGLLVLHLSRKEFKRKNLMMIERYKTETLVQKVLPPEITQQMRSTQKQMQLKSIMINTHNAPIHDKYATVAFVKISLFNSLGERVSDDKDPEVVVSALHQIVRKFDKIIFLYNGVQKVEHVANTYLLCSGLMDDNLPNHIHPQLMLTACIALKDICCTLRLKNGNFVQITVGIHSGNVIGTVIGAHRRFFRIFGDTVNTASRICTTGVKYKINISQKVHELCGEYMPGDLDFEKRENIAMKGKGTMDCYVLNHNESAHKSLDKKYKTAQKYSSTLHDAKSRNSMPRWMVQGSILVKQNTKQSTDVYVNRLQEVTNSLYHKPWVLTFDTQTDTKPQRKQQYAMDKRRCSITDIPTLKLEEKFRNQQFEKRKRSSNWFMFTLFISSLLSLAAYTAYNVADDIIWIAIPLSTFSFSCVTYALYSCFLSHEIRQFTHVAEFATLAISAGTLMHCIAYFHLDQIHNISLLFFILFCVSFSKLPHLYSIITNFIVCIGHIGFFSFQILNPYLSVYIVIICCSFLLSSWFTYHVEYKLRELFIINLAYEKDQDSITKELSTLLPGFVIERMIGPQNNKQQIIDKFNNATIFESDLVGFTKYSSTRAPSEVVSLLNTLYMKLDQVCSSFGLEKIDTIGDAYICINFTGSPDPILQFALKLVSGDVFDESSSGIGIRIGIATGRVIGTVLGECTKRYAVFGDALNRAIKLEEMSNNKKILCCKNTYKRASKLFKFSPFVNGPSNTTAYWLNEQNIIQQNEH